MVIFSIGCSGIGNYNQYKSPDLLKKIYYLYQEADLLVNPEVVSNTLDVTLTEKPCISRNENNEKSSCGYFYDLDGDKAPSPIGSRVINGKQYRGFHYHIYKDSTIATLAFYINTQQSCLTKQKVEAIFGLRLQPTPHMQLSREMHAQEGSGIDILPENKEPNSQGDITYFYLRNDHRSSAKIFFIFGNQQSSCAVNVVINFSKILTNK